MARDGTGGGNPGNGHPTILLRPPALVLFVEVIPTLRGRNYFAQALVYEDGVRRVMYDLAVPLSYQTRRNHSYRVEVSLVTTAAEPVTLVVHAAIKPGTGEPPDSGESAPIRVSAGNPQLISVELAT